MIPKILYINLALALISGFFWVQTYEVWQEDPLANVRVEAVKTPQAEGAGRKGVSAGTDTNQRRTPKSAYNDVVEKNLFSETRSRYVPPVAETSAEPEKPKEVVVEKIDGRRIVLYGVIIMADYKAALINNIAYKTGEKREVWVKPGDRIGQYRVHRVEADSIVLQDDDRKRYRVALYDKDRKKTASGRKPEQATEPTVVKAQPAAPKRPAAGGRTAKPKQPADGDGDYIITQTPFGPIIEKKR